MNLRFTFTAAAIAAASIASPAVAHTINATPTCEGARLTASNFPRDSISFAQYGINLSYNGSAHAGPLVNLIIPSGSGGAETFVPWDLRGFGPVRVVIVGSFAAADMRAGPIMFGPTVIECGPTPAPVPSPPEVVPAPPPSTTTAPPPTGITPTVRVTIPGRPDRPRAKARPRLVTCGFVLAHYRGKARAKMMRRHGIPRSCGRPFNPPVLG